MITFARVAGAAVLSSPPPRSCCSKPNGRRWTASSADTAAPRWMQIYNPRILAKTIDCEPGAGVAAVIRHRRAKAGAVYKNVQVLKDESVGNFTRLMASITTWVAPTQGCAYCHDVNNMAADTVYTKVVARRMIQMVQHVNVDWKTHVAETGVTCYTCHRGQPVPANIWFNNPGPVQAGGFAQTPAGKNHPTAVAGDTSLPFDPFTPYLEHDQDIRVVAQQALPGTDRQSIKQTEWTYALMMNFSQSLGRELHVLPQHAVVHRLGSEHPAARHRLVWHPDGAGSECQLPRPAARDAAACPAWAGRGRAESELRDVP